MRACHLLPACLEGLMHGTIDSRRGLVRLAAVVMGALLTRTRWCGDPAGGEGALG